MDFSQKDRILEAIKSVKRLVNVSAVFEGTIEAPETWSDLAIAVVAQKYCKENESVTEAIDRVAAGISNFMRRDDVSGEMIDEPIKEKIKSLIVHQKATFNSPVWFNLDSKVENPTTSACFVLNVEDTMESILDLAKTIGLIYKQGSGMGVNLSKIRSSKERLSGGGVPTGPITFMKIYDVEGWVVKSGGKTRRSAALFSLSVDHPDIEEFIMCKVWEEQKAKALIAAGYDKSFGGEAYQSVFYQMGNNSVRVTDSFMEAVQDDEHWDLKAVTTGQVLKSVRARDLFRQMCRAAWECGDPGVVFHDTVNEWNTTDKELTSCNACSEVHIPNDGACNLACINIKKYIYPKCEERITEKDTWLRNEELPDILKWFELREDVGMIIRAQDALIDHSSYPTPEIQANAIKYRPLGLGITNLGAVLMELGLPYDSYRGRTLAATLMGAVLVCALEASARSYSISAPTCAYFNKERYLEVIRRHIVAMAELDVVEDIMYLYTTQKLKGKIIHRLKRLQQYIENDEVYIRNAFLTSCMPTGTTSFMLDCTTTGVEPAIALVNYKQLSDGGVIKQVNTSVPTALRNLGYDETSIGNIIKHIENTGTIENSELFEDHLPVFDCAFAPTNGTRSISPIGHVEMLAALQPFVSQATSKTVNLPNTATVEDIEEIYVQAWKSGIKAIAVYRDGCKQNQPLVLEDPNQSQSQSQLQPQPRSGPQSDQKPVSLPITSGDRTRERLPDERESLTHKFSIGGHEGYIIVGKYPDGRPGELFIAMAKQGSTVSGLVDSFAIAVSIALQHGVALRTLVDKFKHTRYEPAGYTENPEIGFAYSITDYAFRWLETKFGDLGSSRRKAENAVDTAGTANGAECNEMACASVFEEPISFKPETDSPACPDCGSIMVRSGSCHRCISCGTSNGCG